MSIDLNKWQLIGSGDPIPQWKPLENNGALALAEGVETFLVRFTDLKPDTPDYLYRSKLVLQPKYELPAGQDDIESKAIWLRPSDEPKEITIPYPKSLLIDGTIFRSFEFRRWNRYNRLGRNHDGSWKFEVYKSLRAYSGGELPPPPEQPPGSPEWIWIPPSFN